MDMISDDIILNSYYAIKKFHDEGKPISFIKIQKIMYFVEMLYMNIFDNKELFSTKWYAGKYGPVSRELYEEFIKFKGNDIELNPEQLEKIKTVPEINRKLVDKIFDMLGTFDTPNLVMLTHEKGTPWSELKNKYGLSKMIKSNLEIDKVDSSNWYREKLF